MKSLKILMLALLVAVSFSSCDEDSPLGSEATILGRWVPVGFDTVIRYDFIEGKRYTIYGDGEGGFPTLAEFLLENPQIPGHNWHYSGDTVVVNLTSGNFSKFIPQFKCNNEVVDFLHFPNNGSPWTGAHYREGHDISLCN